MTTCRPAAPPARRPVGRLLLGAGGVVALAVALLGAGAVLAGPDGGQPPGPALAPPAAGSRLVVRDGSLPAAVTALQERLRRAPANDRAWAELGSAYAAQARQTADPSLYGKADGAFAESLRRRPASNDAALAGQAQLAASRHAFARAVDLADAALQVNAYSPGALAVKVDGLTELGRYDAARQVLERLLRLHPGVDAFTRTSYQDELRGDVDSARSALERALAVAATPPDRAFCLYYLGELAWNNGDPDGAGRAYDAAIAADPTYVVALTGRAKVAALHGDVERALADGREAVARQPQPGSVVELGELLQAQGRTVEAEEQYRVVRATQQLYAASGQVVDAELALFEADHGTPDTALALAARAHAARPDSVVAQDAYGWALHRAGRDTEALAQAQASLRTGLHSAPFRYHLGGIEAALGQREAARRDLTTALTLAPDWAPLQAPEARRLLEGLR